MIGLLVTAVGLVGLAGALWWLIVRRLPDSEWLARWFPDPDAAIACPGCGANRPAGEACDPHCPELARLQASALPKAKK